MANNPFSVRNRRMRKITKKHQSDLMTRVRTGAIEGAVLIVFIIPGIWVTFFPVILFAFVTFMMTIEHVKAVNLRMPGIKIIPTAIFTVVAGLVAFLGILKDSFVRGLPMELVKTVDATFAFRSLGVYALVLIVCLPLLGLPRLWKHGSEELPLVIAVTWIIFSCSLPLASTIALLYGFPIGWRYFVLAVLTTIISDTASYFVGKAFGKHKMIPMLSPNKTWEGTLGGVLATIILYIIYVPLLIGRPLGFSTVGSLAFAVVTAFLMSAVSTFGDLSSSAVKRWCNIKDFGTLLPGHGGISDRFDSLKTVVPTMLAVATLARLMV